MSSLASLLKGIIKGESKAKIEPAFGEIKAGLETPPSSPAALNLDVNQTAFARKTMEGAEKKAAKKHAEQQKIKDFEKNASQTEKDRLDAAMGKKTKVEPQTAMPKPADPTPPQPVESNISKAKAKADKQAPEFDINKKAELVTATNLPKGFNVDSAWLNRSDFTAINTADEMKATIANIAEDAKSMTLDARGDKFTQQQALEFMQETGVTEKALESILSWRELGGAPAPQVIYATRSFLKKSAEQLRALGDVVKDNPTSAERALFARQMIFHEQVLSEFKAAGTNASNQMRALNFPVGGGAADYGMLEDVFQLGTGKTVDEMAALISGKADLKEINDIISGSSGGSKFWGSIGEMFRGNILSSLTTLAANELGAEIILGRYQTQLKIASHLGRFMTAEESVLVGELAAFNFGMRKSIISATKAAWEGMKSGKSADGFTKEGISYHKYITAESLMRTGKMGKIADFLLSKFPNVRSGAEKAIDGYGTLTRLALERGLTPVDEFNKTIARGGFMSQQAYRDAYIKLQGKEYTSEEFASSMNEFMANPPIEALRDSDEFAKFITMQQENGEFANHFGKMMKKFPPSVLWQPFYQVVVNLFKEGTIEGTSIGRIMKNTQLAKDLAEGGRKADQARAKVYIGDAFATAGLLFAYKGFITPPDSGVNWKELAVRKAAGYQPNALVTENADTGEVEYTSFTRLEPMSTMLSVFGYLGGYFRAKEIYHFPQEDEAKMTEFMSEVVVGFAEALNSKSATQGAMDLMDLISNPSAKKLQRKIKQTAASLTPLGNASRFFAGLIDDKSRHASTTFEILESKTPVLSKNLHAKLDIYGEDKTKTHGFLFKGSTRKRGSLASRVEDIMMHSKVVPVSHVSWNVDGVDISNSSDMKSRLEHLSRREVEMSYRGVKYDFKGYLREVMDSSTFQDMTSYTQAHTLKKVQRMFDKEARRQLREEFPALDRNINKLQDLKYQMKYGGDRGQ